MAEESRSFPARPHSHVVGDAALTAFNHSRPPEWVITSVSSDYGWDLYVEIPEAGEMKGLAFSVQLKGTDKPDFVDNGMQISFPLQVSTVNFLLAKLEPAMLAVCHTSIPDQPVYWQWLNEAIEIVKAANPLWHKQETVTIHLPTSRKLTRTEALAISEHVRKRHDAMKIAQRVSEVLGLGINETQLDPYRGEPERYVKELLLPKLSAAGLIDVFESCMGESTEALSTDDQSRYTKLREVGQLLGQLRDREADTLLNQIGSDIASASDGIKARYWNSCGVLALHKFEDSEALTCFEKAVAIRPHEPKFITNQLFLQLHMMKKTPHGKSDPIPADLTRRLDEVLERNPEFSSAVRLKAFLIAESDSAEAAETYLSASKAWETDRALTRECLAEIYKDAGNNQKALSLLEEAVSSEAELKPTSSSLKAFVFMRLAINDTSTADELELRGYGPKELDVKYLRRSFQLYNQAIAGFRETGFPLVSESTIVNFSAVASLLQQPGASEEPCRQFLEYHPESTSVSAALASSLVYQRRPSEAVSILKTLHRSPRIFKNLILAQLIAEEHEEALAIVRKREESGFSDVEEEGVARSVAAVALAELGEQTKAQEQVQILRRKPELLAQAIVAEADVVWRTTRDSEKVSRIYEEGLAISHNDPFLQMMCALQIGVGSPDAARITVPVLESLDQSRQLAPEEYLLWIRGCLLLDLPERAAGVLDRALARFPKDSRLLFEHSSVQWVLGNEEGAYHSIQEYLKREKSYQALRECAVLARNTGRLDVAIKSFELASRKTDSPEQLGAIHSQLYLLKKLRRDAPKDILRHAYEFGKTTDDDPEKEAQYFMMFLTAPGDSEAGDPEIKAWCEETQNRIHNFSQLHPQFHSFRAIRFDATKPIGDQFKDAITDIIAKTLPRELATTPMRMAARSQNWPLVLRATYYPDIHSMFELWDKCTKSKDFEYGIHIWANKNDPISEQAAVERTAEVCIDITALLTLAQLDLLEAFSDTFDRIFLAKGTKQMLDLEQVSLSGPHPLSEKINKWRVNNISKIRTRKAEESKAKSSQGAATVLATHDDISIDKLLGGGVGESLLLSRRLGISLYSDESSVRVWSVSEYGVQSFSTLAFLKHYQQASRLNEMFSIRLEAEMIRRNFRVVPFTAVHLVQPLREVIKQKGDDITSADLREHPVLGVYLKEFAESFITVASLARVAVDWWFAIVFDRDIPISCLPACLEPPSSALILWRTISGVIEQAEAEPERRAAALWAGFLWRCYRRDDGQVEAVWGNIKDCCSRIFHGQYEKQRAVLFQHMPRVLLDIASTEVGLSSNQRWTLYISLPWKLPQPDKAEWEKEFFKHSQRLPK
jgi:tetratricopeptide (TPR) repeat protein